MKRFFPVLALALLSPFVAEVLFGATPLSRLASLPPLILLYGGGAVLIRELARRIGPGWDRIAWLAAAYALVEEGLVMQTLFSPDLFGAAACGGRLLGVNWVWTEALIGYHMVWSIIIPIALVETLFPERRAQPWLGRKGIAIALACYLLGAVAIGITFRRIITPHFRASTTLLACTADVSACLIAWALFKPRNSPSSAAGAQGGSAPSPWIAGSLTFVAASFWIQLFMLRQPLSSGWIVLFPMLFEAFLAWRFVVLVRRWAQPGCCWTDRHQHALVTGALAASILYGAKVIAVAAPFDRLGQAVCGILTLTLLGLWKWLNRRGSGAVSDNCSSELRTIQ
jgi:hypothetical protein